MTIFLASTGTPSARSSARRTLVVGLAVCIAATMSSCGKAITIGDKAAPAATAAASPATEPAAEATTEPAADAGQSAGDQASGNAALQVLDTTAAEAGKTGNGGTVVGINVQQVPPKWVQLTAVKSAALNQAHLVNINKAALYRFEKDIVGSSQSNCNDNCATKWPPVILKEGGAVFLDGVEEDQVEAFRRSDGQIQLTVGGSPVYRFTGDSKPGDLKGQGVDGTWFAISPTGQAIG